MKVEKRMKIEETICPNLTTSKIMRLDFKVSISSDPKYHIILFITVTSNIAWKKNV